MQELGTRLGELPKEDLDRSLTGVVGDTNVSPIYQSVGR